MPPIVIVFSGINACPGRFLKRLSPCVGNLRIFFYVTRLFIVID